MSGLIGKDRPDKDADIVILTKFIVTPNKAEDFIEVFKKVCAQSFTSSNLQGHFDLVWHGYQCQQGPASPKYSPQADMITLVFVVHCVLT